MRHSSAWSGRRVLLAAFGVVFSAIKAAGRQSQTKTELRVELKLLGVKRTCSGWKVHSWSVSSLINRPKGLVGIFLCVLRPVSLTQCRVGIQLHSLFVNCDSLCANLAQ